MPPRKIPATVSPSSTPVAARARRAPPLPRTSLPPTSAGVQVNFCKNPTCANYGAPVPMQKTPGVKGTYRLIGAGANKGSIHVRCMLCNEKIPMKSNAGIVEELARMQAPLAALKPTCCPHASCANHAIPVGTAGAYKAFGYNSAGNPRWMCKECGKTFSRALDPAKWQETSSKNRLIFKLLVSDTPFARIADVVELDERTIGRRVKFIHRQVVAFAAAREAKLAELEIPRLYISADGQEQIINWRDKEDRRNVVLSAIASVDNPTGYCFGMHLNFDPSLDRAAIEAEATRIGDVAKPTPLRKFSRLWLEADYTDAAIRKVVRARAKAAQPIPAPGLAGAIDAAYEAQHGREDIEAPEEADGFRMLPEKGMQTRRDYTMAAHFAYLRRLMPKVGKWRFFLDQDPGMRAAVMSAFVEEIKAETCDAWFVRINKDLTIDKRRQARRIAKLRFESVKAANPGLSDREVVREMIKTAHAAMTQHGNWNDRWLDHPYPNMSEPEKATTWLTERPNFTPDHAAALYAMASLHGVDSLFNQMRRRSRLLERPLHTASGSGRVWSAYSAYDPAQTMRMIEIVRVCHNFVWPGEKDGKTPAMRIGLARAPIDYADILAFVP